MKWIDKVKQYLTNRSCEKVAHDRLVGDPIIGRDVTLRELVDYQGTPSTVQEINQTLKPGMHLAAKGDKAAAAKMLLGNKAAPVVEKAKPRDVNENSGIVDVSPRATLLITPDGKAPTEIIYPSKTRVDRGVGTFGQVSVNKATAWRVKSRAYTMIFYPGSPAPTELVTPA